MYTRLSRFAESPLRDVAGKVGDPIGGVAVWMLTGKIGEDPAVRTGTAFETKGSATTDEPVHSPGETPSFRAAGGVDPFG
jgi:hypothetical protein